MREKTHLFQSVPHANVFRRRRRWYTGAGGQSNVTLFRRTIKDLGADQEWKRGNAALRVRVSNVFAPESSRDRSLSC